MENSRGSEVATPSLNVAWTMMLNTWQVPSTKSAAFGNPEVAVLRASNGNDGNSVPGRGLAMVSPPAVVKAANAVHSRNLAAFVRPTKSPIL